MEFLLDPDVTFLNHGSYGACPVPVFEAYQRRQRELERNPVEFLGRRFHELTGEARSAGTTLVCAEPDEVAATSGPRTRAVSVSHITSPTALVLPIAEICAAAREAGVLSVVDGAHAPGQRPLDLEVIGADVYAGNCHKWLLAPKGAAFLWARPEQQSWIDPLVVSWGYDEGFVRRHGW